MGVNNLTTKDDLLPRATSRIVRAEDVHDGDGVAEFRRLGVGVIGSHIVCEDQLDGRCSESKRKR